MKLYAGITDYDWFKLHASKAKVEEANFREAVVANQLQGPPGERTVPVSF